MTRSTTSAMAHDDLSSARTSPRSGLRTALVSGLLTGLRTTAMTLRIAVVTLTIVAMTATALVFGSQGSAQANEQTAADTPADDPTVTTELTEVTAEAAPSSNPVMTRSSFDKETRAARSKMLLAREMQYIRSRIVEVARNQIGDLYIPGASGPHGFDCSGLTRFVYQQAADITLPHYSRAQYGKVTRIPRAEAKPGDLVFFFQSGAHHVGIYIGDGKMIDAPGRGDRVRVSPTTGSWWGRTFTGMGRVLPA